MHREKTPDGKARIAFIENCYQLYEQKMYQAAYRILYDSARAEDAVQDAFLKLMKGGVYFEDAASDAQEIPKKRICSGQGQSNEGGGSPYPYPFPCNAGSGSGGFRQRIFCPALGNGGEEKRRSPHGGGA